LAVGEAPAKKSDLGVRVVSAIVMLAVAIGAALAGERALDLFLALVGLITFAEYVRLILRATDSIAYRAIGLIFGVAYIGFAVHALIAADSYYLVAALGAVIATDVFAYFFGRSIGGPKIAPSISPSKTWAGLIGGMIGAAVWLGLWVATFHYTSGYTTMAELAEATAEDSLGAAALGVVLAAAAQSGDFFESWLKRKAGMKDSSKLIPGHGGVFDRVDGVIPVAFIVGLLSGVA